MIDSRTTKVLGALLVSMTLGALVLMFMETESPRPGRRDMASIVTRIVNRSWKSDQRWKRIVVHTSRGEDTMPSRCHFIIHANPVKGSWISPTTLWRDQKPGRHTNVPTEDYNIDSIGICVIGDFSHKEPTAGQFKALITLVNYLQKIGAISSDRVYFQSQLLSNYPNCKKFPEKLFNDRLLRIN